MDIRARLAAYPADVPVDPTEVAAANAASPSVLIVLDDDPTGTQSVHGLPVLTHWTVDDLAWAMRSRPPAVYVMTNTRSLDEAETAARNSAIVRSAIAAAAPLGLAVRFVSRGDSTLRGHFPLETDVLAQTLVETTGDAVDGVVIVPAFPDAGRVTIGGVHFMRSGDALTPVAETEFARDATFGYEHSELASWVEEKSGGRVPAARVIVLDLGIIRAGATAIADAIAGASDRTPIVADAVTEDDLRLLALGLIEAESRGANLLYRVGPPFVRARIGQAQRAPLTAADVFADRTPSTGGGLIVVGSHVGLTTRQLERLRAAQPEATTIELSVERIAGRGDADRHLTEVAERIARRLVDGNVILHTSRTLVKTDDPAESLEIARRVSAAVVAVVQRTIAAHAPRFVVAKGGITSSDVATLGLGIRHAIVRGPMLPGIVSLWEPVDGPAAGIPYVVFAGNVGDDDSLAEVVATLTAPVR